GTEEPLDRPCDFEAGQYSVYRRPFLDEFLAAVFDWYEVAVWSSASPRYVAGVVAGVFPRPEALRFVWARHRCTARFHHHLRHYYWVKDLKKVKRAGTPL